jgi:hypothetical protein
MQKRNLRLSVSRFKVGCFDSARMGLHFVQCFLLEIREEVSTDHLLVSREAVKVLDERE